MVRPTVASSSYTPYLNLGEVLLYDESGEQIPKADILGAKLSSQWDGEAYPASNCINGDLGDFCHTGDGDPSPTLAVVYRCASGATALSKVEVYNRAECCQDRINSYTMDFLNAKGEGPWVVGVFKQGQATAGAPPLGAGWPSRLACLAVAAAFFLGCSGVISSSTILSIGAAINTLSAPCKLSCSLLSKPWRFRRH